MDTLLSNDAILLVRKNLDEVGPNDSVMYTDENKDNESLNDIIRKNIAEAINAVHKAAPVWLLEGKTATYKENTEMVTYNYQDEDPQSNTYGKLHLQLADDAKFLRLVAFQANDSPIVITDIIGEASAEGRKQLNKYIQGKFDRPRLVGLQGAHSSPQFDYYTLKAETMENEPIPTENVKQFLYIEEQFYKAPTVLTANPSYDISRRLRQNIIDHLTALVMEIYQDQRAQVFYQKANIFPTI